MKNKEDLDSWYKIKRYPHIGLPSENRRQTISYIKNKDKIAVHGFAPFIHKVISTNRYRKEYDNDGKLINNGKRTDRSRKDRDIYYANNLDSNIYAYYSHLLNVKYEDILEDRNLTKVVTAYRKTPKKLEPDRTQKPPKKNNIYFADEVFEYIKNNVDYDNGIVAIAFDIKNFFPSLNHTVLKNKWCEVLDVDHLPKDHYNVFKNITRFSYVEEKHLFNLFKDNILIRKNEGKVTDKSIKRIEHLYNKNAIAYCKMQDIHTIRKKGLMRSSKRISSTLVTDGICQGSAISATLANIYMLGFDEAVYDAISKIGGLYRRYSDDMVVVCPTAYKSQVIQLFEDKIKDIKLEIHGDKTQVFHFSHCSGKVICKQEFNSRITPNSINRNFEYLGFSFDGEYVRLKTSSLGNYYRKMKKGVRRSGFYSSKINNDTRGEIFRKRLYKRYSYIGAKYCIKYKRVRGTTDQWQPDKYAINWGNYITYAKNAHEIMDSYSKIDSQIKNHWKNLHKEIEKSK